MMNGTEKSDTSIVPANPANKVERSAAELGEGSDGTKRNAKLQSTDQTQGWEAVTQAQARIRGAVRRNKKEKLTALLHHVSIDGQNCTPNYKLGSPQLCQARSVP
jgi:RNA-directed DNA polymerase